MRVSCVGGTMLNTTATTRTRLLWVPAPPGRPLAGGGEIGGRTSPSFFPASPENEGRGRESGRGQDYVETFFLRREILQCLAPPIPPLARPSLHIPGPVPVPPQTADTKQAYLHALLQHDGDAVLTSPSASRPRLEPHDAVRRVRRSERAGVPKDAGE